MDTLTPIRNWCHPFKSKLNALQQLTLFANAKSGFYPIGANGLWHGGVHFDAGTAALIDQSQVFCMADGEVVAYRIDDTYPISEYPAAIPQITRAPFSTGFVLVRHRLEPPAETGAETTSRPSLTLFSLYMHLQDWATYQTRSDLPRPTFWGDVIYTVNTKKDGLNVRASANGTSAILGKLSKGARIHASGSGEFLQIQSLEPGGVFMPAEGVDETREPQGYVSAKFLKTEQQPGALGEVVVLEKPVPIKAGDLIGHPGLYQNQTDATPQSITHIETFSCDDVPAFIAKSRAYAASQPDSARTLLKIHKGMSKLIPHRNDISPENPPRVTDDGPFTGVDLIIPQSLLDDLSSDAKLVVPGIDGRTQTKWWRLEGLLADTHGAPIDGWLAEQDLVTTRHSPWEWEGYECLEDTAPPKAKLVSWLDATKQLTKEEQSGYKSMIDMERQGPLKLTLHDIMDTDHNGVITTKEIRAALSKPWQAQRLAQLVVKYESEWFWNSERWGTLDSALALTKHDSRSKWLEEKIKIEKICWWNYLEFLTKHNVWHLNAPGYLYQFSKKPEEQKIYSGRITFEAEGSSVPSSPFFSRNIHWPGNELSGVTVGRGYDLGFRSKTEVIKHLTNSGIPQAQAEHISEAAGMRGAAARNFVKANKEKIGMITCHQEINLFNSIYPSYARSAESNYEKWTSDEPSRVPWENLDKKIKDILVDFVYQGFTRGPNPMKAGMHNDRSKLIIYIESTPAISQYEPGRRRAKYLRDHND